MGVCGDFPENTLAGFLDCERQGVFMLEVDVRQTADSVLVLMHDRSVARTTDGETRFPGRTDVDELSLEEFRSLVIDDDGCLEDPDAKPDRCHPPTLQELLERTGQQTILELDFYAGDPTKAASLIESQEAVDRVLFYNRNIEVLRGYRERVPGGFVMPLAREPAGVDALLEAEYDDLDIRWITGHPQYAAEVKERMKAAGVRLYVNAWSADDPVDEWFLAAIAADESGEEELAASYHLRVRNSLSQMFEDGALALGSNFAQVYVQYLYPNGFGH